MPSIKRPVDGQEAKCVRKRQKAEEEKKRFDESPQSLGQAGPSEDRIFRFLDLPGGYFTPGQSDDSQADNVTEIRNRIYGIAVDWAQTSFPPTYLKSKPMKRKRLQPCPSSQPEQAVQGQPSLPLPFHGLTQVCSVIRAEFRPLWLSCHRFPVTVVNGYLKAFFPSHLPQTDRRRLDSYCDPAGQLCVQVGGMFTRNNHDGIDILRLLKHKARYPLYTLKLVHVDCVGAPDLHLDSLSALLNNENPTWMSWIKGTTISQIRLICERHWIRLVVKDKFAPAWMRPMLEDQTKVPDGFLESLELEDLPGWTIHFAVDYS